MKEGTQGEESRLNQRIQEVHGSFPHGDSQRELKPFLGFQQAQFLLLYMQLSQPHLTIPALGQDHGDFYSLPSSCDSLVHGSATARRERHAGY